jgi:D-threo-aldose 1-dehydrogenase
MDSLNIPKLIHGSTSLGNIYKVVDYKTKLDIVRNMFAVSEDGTVMIDTAGKYGAGLALESIGKALAELKIDPAKVIISNKLAWIRAPLTTPEPTFEKGAWFGLEHDAVQDISYEGIMKCYRQGNELLGDYETQLVSVHDPDEYLAAATCPEDRSQRLQDITGAYRALYELKADGKVKGVGVGAKDWTIIQELYEMGISLDWVMFANSYTIYKKPPALLQFIESLHRSGVFVINSAVFQGGFLTGGEFYDYARVTRESHPQLFAWRDTFFCDMHTISS